MRSREVSQGRGPAWIGLTVVAAVVLGTVLGVQGRASGQEQNPQRLFNQDGGFVQSVILADKTADFEMVMQKVKEALQKSENPTRQQQLRGWKVYRVAEPGPNGSVIYFMVIDPSARGADYTISTILAEGYPGGEGQQLYTAFSGAFAGGITAMNLRLINDFSR